MKKVIISSKNPVKVTAVTQAFAAMLPNENFAFIAEGFPSLVSDQPMTSEETLRGALNRAQAAREAHPDAAYVVGVEGGLEAIDEDLYPFAWNVIIRKDGKISKNKSASYILPSVVTKKIHAGMELGHALNEVFDRADVKHTSGGTGTLTHDKIDRMEYYTHALILALIPFVNSKLYN